MTMMVVASVMLAPLHASATDNNDAVVDAEASIEYSEEGIIDESAYAGSEEEYAHSYVADAIEAENGIVQINCVYVDEDGKSHIIKGCTGFVIGTMEDGHSTQHVLTCKSAILPDNETIKAALKSFGVKKADIEGKMKNLSYEVVVTQDMPISATISRESDKLDLIVFSVSENLANRVPLSIYTSDDDTTVNLPYSEMDNVHALGYPDAISYNVNPVYYNKKDIGLISGIITNLRVYDNNFSISHTATVNANNCGGPLVNDAGNVIGMNVATKDGQYSVAIDSTELVDVLESFEIEFNKLTPSNMVPEDDASNETSTASTTASTGDSGEEHVIEKIPLWMIIALILVTVFLVAALVAVGIILFIQNSPKSPEEKEKIAAQKAKKKEEKAKMKNHSQELEKPFTPIVNPMANSYQSGGTGMDTNCLSISEGAGAEAGTTILSEAPVIGRPQGAAINGGTLIRKKNGDNIILCKPDTKIGKDSLHVDYCVRDNSAISRVHALFRVTPQGAFVEDCGSTNGTFVNGIRLNVHEAKLLNKGDVIRLANEEFDYRK